MYASSDIQNRAAGQWLLYHRDDDGQRRASDLSRFRQRKRGEGVDHTDEAVATRG